MYPDINNLVIQEDYRGKRYNESLLRGKYNLRRDNYIVMNEHFKILKNFLKLKKNNSKDYLYSLS